MVLKSRYTNAYRPDKRIDLSLAVWVSHSCNRLWNSKSKLSFTLICCRQSKAIQKRRYFLLAYRWHCPALSRHPKSVKKDIQLFFYYDIILLYLIEQLFVNTFRISFWIFFGELGRLFNFKWNLIDIPFTFDVQFWNNVYT